MAKKQAKPTVGERASVAAYALLDLYEHFVIGGAGMAAPSFLQHNMHFIGDHRFLPACLTAAFRAAHDIIGDEMIADYFAERVFAAITDNDLSLARAYKWGKQFFAAAPPKFRRKVLKDLAEELNNYRP